MQLEIISIGQELLFGQTINTNATFISEELGGLGIVTSRVIVIPDSEEIIHHALAESFSRVDFVILTGGLGPTPDDVTKKALCSFFGTEMVLNYEVLADITDLFSKMGLQVTELNRQQALVPRTARVFRNSIGTAPGLWLEKDGKACVALPGVPYEMKQLMFEKIVPILKETIGGNPIIHRTILTHGMGESFMADIISGWENNLPSHVSLAYLPSPGIVKLRLSASGKGQAELQAELKHLENELQSLLGELVWGYNNDTLEELIGKILLDAGKSISTAESFTGGYVAHKLTTIAGSSRYFNGSIIAYSNKLKIDLLNVEKTLLENYGAVSREVVEAMAANGRKITGSDYCIATSGIAGPGGGTEQKPVGTTWIAVAWYNGVESKLLNLGDNRERNILRATIAALAMAKKIIEFELTYNKSQIF